MSTHYYYCLLSEVKPEHYPMIFEIAGEPLNEGSIINLERMILPQNTMTEWIWSGSLAAFARVVKLRTDPHSQYETSLVAYGIKYHLDNLFPASTKALLAYD